MKSRATGKVEVTRHVISCELLLNDGSLSSGLNFVIDMVLIYFLTETKKKTEMNYCSEILSYFPAIKPKRTDLLSKGRVPVFGAEKIPSINRSCTTRYFLKQQHLQTISRSFLYSG